MKKRLLALSFCLILAVGMMTACGTKDTKDKTETKEEKVTYDVTDDTGIINVNLMENFEFRDSSSYETGCSVNLATEVGAIADGTYYVDATVSFGQIYDYSLKSDARTIGTYTYAEDTKTEEVEFLGMTGYKVTYLDTDSINKDTINTFYVLTPKDTPQDGSNGYKVNIRLRSTEAGIEIVTKQAEQFVFDFDAHDFSK